MNKNVSVYRRMLFYFSLIIIASLFMIGEFIYQVDRNKFKTQYSTVLEKYKSGEISLGEANQPVADMKRKVIVLLLLYFIFVTIIIVMIIKDIVLPIRYMIKIADKISAGDLSRTINLERNDDLARLGNVINELTSNLQELIAVTGNLNDSLPVKSENIKKWLYKLSEVKTKKDLINIVKGISDEIKDIKRSADELKMIFDAFNLYTIKPTSQEQEERGV